MKNYLYILVPLISVLTCQIIKFIIECLAEKKIKWERLFNGMGGMPSSHTTFCTSLTVYIGLTQGFQNPLFAIAMVFSILIAYDAMGLRMESEKQAIAINKLAEKVYSTEEDKKIEILKEELGHKPLEVLVGIIFGSLMAVFFYYIF